MKENIPNCFQNMYVNMKKTSSKFGNREVSTKKKTSVL